MRVFIYLSLLILVYLFFYFRAEAANPLDIVINEIAWMGTQAHANDEWIELFNNTGSTIDLEGWILESQDGSPKILLKGTITQGGYYLMERTNDETISDVSSDLIYTGALSNEGEILILKDKEGNIIDKVSQWYGGDNSTKKTMERIDPKISGDDQNNWASNDGIKFNGKDAKGNQILGTAKSQNSVYLKAKTSPEELSSQAPTQTQNPQQNQVSQTNQPPIVEIEDKIYLFIGEPLKIDTTQIKDPENEGLSFFWNFGDGTTSEQREASHIYKFPGTYIVTLKVFDGTNEVNKQILAIVYPKGVYINELFPNPEGKDQGQEFIELYNANDFSIDLSGFFLESNSKKFVFSKDSIIYSKSYLVLPSQTTKITLKNKEGSLKFFSPQGQLLQEINYKEAKQGFSLAKSGEAFLWTTISTPGSKNILQDKEEIKSNIEPIKSEIKQTKQVKKPELKNKVIENKVIEEEKNLLTSQLSSTLSFNLAPVLKEIIITVASLLVFGFVAYQYIRMQKSKIATQNGKRKFKKRS